VLWLFNALCTVFWPLVYFYPPFRGTVAQRMGNFDTGSYSVERPDLKVLINAVSAGEVVAIAPFIRELKARLPDAQVALLTTTESGQTMAKSKLQGLLSLLAYFPLADLWFVSRRYVERLKPDLYVTTEAELWPNIQSRCRRRGIPVALVNARLYLHNKRGLRGLVVRQLYSLCDLIVCQDERQRANFLKFGVPAERLIASGNTKFDFELAQWSSGQLSDFRSQLGLSEPLIVAGSTHSGEEELLLNAFMELRPGNPGLRLVLAPRHIERADEVIALASAKGLRAVTMGNASGVEKDVVIVDRYGALVDVYRLATVVVMGGTFHPKVGGHNILEATALGKAVICGPHTFGITAQLELLQTENAVVTLNAADELPAALARLLGEGQERERVGRAARVITEANRGAAQRAVEVVLELKAQTGSAPRSSGI
jgi:3-deoxy-D-manno-octulosonic-acid transferase